MDDSIWLPNGRSYRGSEPDPSAVRFVDGGVSVRVSGTSLAFLPESQINRFRLAPGLEPREAYQRLIREHLYFRKWCPDIEVSFEIAEREWDALSDYVSVNYEPSFPITRKLKLRDVMRDDRKLIVHGRWVKVELV